MSGFIVLNRMLAEDKSSPLMFNLANIVAIYPAVDFSFEGEAIERDGSYVLTVNDHGENSGPWHVVETFDYIAARLPSGFMFGGAA